MNRKILALIAFMLILPSVSKAEFVISPVKAYLKTGEKVTSISITNNGDSEASFQLEQKKWIKASDKDFYEDSKDLLLTPVIFTLQPGKKQLIRIGLRSETLRADEEKAYRVFVKELPKPKWQQETSAALNFVLELSIPVFVEPKQLAERQELDCKVLDENSEEATINCKNTSNVHASLNALEFLNEKKEKISQNLGHYISPNSEFSATIRKENGLELKNGKIIFDRMGGERHLELKDSTGKFIDEQ